MQRLAPVLNVGNPAAVFIQPGVDVAEDPLIGRKTAFQFVEGIVVGGEIPGQDFVALSGALNFFTFRGNIAIQLLKTLNAVRLERFQAAQGVGTIVQVGTGRGERQF